MRLNFSFTLIDKDVRSPDDALDAACALAELERARIILLDLRNLRRQRTCAKTAHVRAVAMLSEGARFWLCSVLAQLAHAISSELPKNETLRYPPQKQAASSPAVSVTLSCVLAVHHAEGGQLVHLRQRHAPVEFWSAAEQSLRARLAYRKPCIAGCSCSLRAGRDQGERTLQRPRRPSGPPGAESVRLWRLLGGLAYGSLPSGSASIHRQRS